MNIFFCRPESRDLGERVLFRLLVGISLSSLCLEGFWAEAWRGGGSGVLVAGTGSGTAGVLVAGRAVRFGKGIWWFQSRPLLSRMSPVPGRLPRSTDLIIGRLPTLNLISGSFCLPFLSFLNSSFLVSSFFASSSFSQFLRLSVHVVFLLYLLCFIFSLCFLFCIFLFLCFFVFILYLSLSCTPPPSQPSVTLSPSQGLDLQTPLNGRSLPKASL